MEEDIFVDLCRIELPPRQCECRVIPLDHRPKNHKGHNILSQKNKKSIPLCLQYESNTHPPLRTGLFYPLNYGGKTDNARFKPFSNVNLAGRYPLNYGRERKYITSLDKKNRLVNGNLQKLLFLLKQDKISLLNLNPRR